MTWPGLTQDVERLCSTCPVCQLTKMELKKYGLLPPKTAESDPWVMVCVDLVCPFTIKIPLKTHSLLALTMIDPANGWFEIVKATNKSAASIQDLFHNTWLHAICVLNSLSLTMGVNSNVSSNKCVRTMASKPHQLQATILKQMQDGNDCIIIIVFFIPVL
jgi:hypothetical protein